MEVIRLFCGYFINTVNGDNLQEQGEIVVKSQRSLLLETMDEIRRDK